MPWLLAVLMVASAACKQASNESDGASPPADQSGSDLVAHKTELTGEAEVPGPGDPDGSGSAEITVEPGSTKVCFKITILNVDDITAAHIHEGRLDSAGPIAVTLTTPTGRDTERCVSSTTSIIDALLKETRAFYVNVHSTEFPDGAVRGQLTT